MSSVTDFENAMRRELDTFNEQRSNPRATHKPPRQKAKPHVDRQPGLVVRLAVRKQRISLDTEFVYTANTVSRLEAQLEAEKAARAAGWPIIGYLISIEKDV